MSNAVPGDGSSNTDSLKGKLMNPFSGLREKFRDSKLYDVKVGLVHKKYIHLAIFELWAMLTLLGMNLESLRTWYSRPLHQ